MSEDLGPNLTAQAPDLGHLTAHSTREGRTELDMHLTLRESDFKKFREKIGKIPRQRPR